MLKDSNLQYSSVAENIAKSAVFIRLGMWFPTRDSKMTETFRPKVQSTGKLMGGEGRGQVEEGRAAEKNTDLPKQGEAPSPERQKTLLQLSCPLYDEAIIYFTVAPSPSPLRTGLPQSHRTTNCVTRKPLKVFSSYDMDTCT